MDPAWRGVVASALLAMVMMQSRTIFVHSSCFPAIFNFGDSTSDTGAIHAAFPYATPAEFLPYGETYFTKPNVRYSDGRLLLDFISAGLGLPFISPFLQSVTSSFTAGANFAAAGATVLNVTYLAPFTLAYQVKQFQEFHDSVLSALITNPNSTRLPPATIFGQALYLIAIGGNDFTYGYTKGQGPAQVEIYLPQVVAGLTGAVQSLYDFGARHIMVFGIEPQGCLPYTLTLIPHSPADLDVNGCLTAYNDADVYFNGLLQTALADLQVTLPLAEIVLLNVYDIKIDLVTNLTQNGFLTYNVACCGVPSQYNYSPVVNCGSPGAVTCPDPSQYVVWDGVHNTEAANKYIAHQIFSGKYFSPAFPTLTTGCGLSPF